MNWLFTALRIYPYWAIPMAFIVFEMGVIFKRRKIDKHWILTIFSILIALSCVLWIVYRGDLYSDLWLKKIF